MIVLEVTQADIDKGIRRSTCRCPIARALVKRGYGNVIVDSAYIYTSQGRCKTPEKAERFMYTFDNEGKKKASPMMVRLDLPKPLKEKK